MGYTNVRHYPGGISTWIEEGGPVEGSSSGAAGWLGASGRSGGSAGPTGSVADVERKPAATADVAISGPSSIAGAQDAVETATGSGRGGSRSAGGGAAPDEGVLSPATRNGWSVRMVDALSKVSFGRLLGLWLGIVLACAAAYWAFAWIGPSLVEAGKPVPGSLSGLLTAVYFSFVTATSLGFGDVLPRGPARVLSVLEAGAGLLLFGCVISKIVSRRQDQLIEETHRNAFEGRLGRVRTNLHLVLSELQKISVDVAEGRLAPDRILSRVESATMVFGGELRAIHDLLYRPQQAPEEPILQAMLANLAASMRELADLLDVLPDARAQSPTLQWGLARISRMAGEICGECVPRAYAPELKVWMDRVQDLARRITPP